MAKKKKRKHRGEGKSDPRVSLVDHITKDVPPGPEGQPAIKAGTPIHLVQVLEWEGVGRVSFSAPRTSALLFDEGRKDIQRAIRMKRTLPQQTQARANIKPFSDRAFTNDSAAYDFFQAAMAGIVLCYAALDSWANESIPENFEMEHKDERLDRGRLEQFGIERRLSLVLSTVMDKPNLMTDRPEIWEKVMALKSLRDDISHLRKEVAYAAAYAGSDPAQTIYARLLNADLSEIPLTVEVVQEHYGVAPRFLPNDEPPSA